MLNKKLMMLSIFIISLLAVTTVSATDNATSEVVSVEETNKEIFAISDNVTTDLLANENDNLKMSSINRDDLSLVNCEDNDSSKEKLAKNQEDALSESEYGSSGHIESKDVTLISKNPIGYKVRLVGKNVANQEVTFEVLEFYDDDGGIQTYDYFESMSDAKGYATLNGYLPYGKYLIVTYTDDHGYVKNYVTVKPNGYKNMYLNVDKSHKSIKYGWSGIFNGYLKIYKNNKLIKKISMKTFDGRYDYWQNFDEYSIKKFAAGKYTVKIVSNKNKIIKKKSFTLNNPKKTSKKKKSSSPNVTFKLKVNSVQYSKARLKTGDIILASANSYLRQHSKGIIMGTKMTPGQEGQHSTKLIKAKVWFKNKRTGKIITRTKLSTSNGYNIKKFEWIDGYTPYKAKVWYKHR